MELVLPCTVIYLVSWLGGSASPGWQWTHTRVQLVLSFVGGFMLGVGLLHLLPHGVAVGGSLETAMPAALIGLLTMFFLIRIFHVHLHAPQEDAPIACHHGVPHAHGVQYLTPTKTVPWTRPQNTTVSDAANTSGTAELPLLPSELLTPNPTSKPSFGWMGLAMGLSLHMLLDGVALAASLTALRGESNLGLAWGPFVAILLHEPLDVMSITTVMGASGWSRRAVLMWNALFAAMCPLGATCYAVGFQPWIDQHAWILGALLAFSAGMFVCIALSDLLPELQFHAHDRWILSIALLAGVFVSYSITWLEPEHLHHWQGDHPAAVHEGTPEHHHSHQHEPDDPR